ncbi:hypothetical protein [Umezawaea tangerina]|uniref:Uncharacterized protein n=1 Tax=Umezawaea tangerina TaxID=84725 RepID=A0A2T0SLI2_9PSEU|nr:hypothetical protein [Umezawaea tangerina]PRY34270.1 hypothetical protein CLV43_11743 [Umezawaea tangerina]
MPGPVLDGENRPRHDASPERGTAIARQAAVDGELALALPQWDLLPPAEFLDRRHRRR